MLSGLSAWGFYGVLAYAKFQSASNKSWGNVMKKLPMFLFLGGDFEESQVFFSHLVVSFVTIQMSFDAQVHHIIPLLSRKLENLYQWAHT